MKRYDVHLSLSRILTAAAACDRFVAGGPVGGRYLSVAAWPVLSSNCEQCLVVGWRRRLNADLFLLLHATVIVTPLRRTVASLP